MLALERFVLWVLFVGAIGSVLWFGVPALVRSVVGQHDQLVLSQSAAGANAQARTAETADTSRAQTACAKSVAVGLRAGRTIERHASAPASERDEVTTADLRNVVGQADAP